jgi:hypothetical protein
MTTTLLASALASGFGALAMLIAVGLVILIIILTIMLPVFVYHIHCNMIKIVNMIDERTNATK